MSILIKGMSIPASCGFCPLRHTTDDGDECYVGAESTEYQKRPDDCPLVYVQPHGDLIDRVELWVEINRICDRRDAGIITDLACLQQILSVVRHAPTIIPAKSITAEEARNDKQGSV